jgi:hypothetical protein
MRAAHGLLILFAVLIVVLSTVAVRTSGTPGGKDPASPDRGTLAPLVPGVVPSRMIARIPPEAGRVEDVAASGDLIAVLTRDQWYLQSRGGLRGGFGDSEKGAPDWLGRPISIAISEDRVYVLDASGFLVSVWDTTGTHLHDITLAPGDAASFQPTQVLAGPADSVVVLAIRIGRDGNASWQAIVHDEEGASRVLFVTEGRRPSAVYDRPLLAWRGGALLGINALDHSIVRVEGPGPPTLYATRSDPPLWKVPGTIRRRHGERLGGMAGGMGSSVGMLPEMWPSVRDFSVAAGDSMLVAVTAGEDRLHVELLAPDERPVRRFSARGFNEPVFLDDGRLFLIHETLDGTEVHELAIHGP